MPELECASGVHADLSGEEYEIGSVMATKALRHKEHKLSQGLLSGSTPGDLLSNSFVLLCALSG